VKIAEFAAAVGEDSPLCFDAQQARQAGYPDVIAPPTFAIVVSAASSGGLVRDPGFGINYAMVVHGEQGFEYARPLHAGDVVTATTTVEQVRPIGKHTSVTFRTEISTTDGEHVCTARNVLVERGE
jgi:acyl dehydratase